MDQGVYRNYLSDGIEGRERLLPVPIAPAPMRAPRRSLRLALPRVSLPRLPVAGALRHAGRCVVEFSVYVLDFPMGLLALGLWMSFILGLGATGFMLLCYWGLKVHNCLVMAGWCFAFSAGAFVLRYSLNLARVAMFRAAGLAPQ